MSLPVNLERRRAIQRLEDHMLAGPQVDCPLEHYFAPGLYARQMKQKAGIVVTGAIHRFSHVSTLSEGECIIITEFDEMHLKAPATWVSQPYIKRAIYALTDITLTTYHVTDTTDIDALWDELSVPSYEDIPEAKQ